MSQLYSPHKGMGPNFTTLERLKQTLFLMDGLVVAEKAINIEELKEVRNVIASTTGAS